MKKNYLLCSALAEALYEGVKDLPVIDYHNHLSLADIKENRRFEDVYELWVQPDPYKHRAMRMCGVPERYITGDAPREEKFAAWWETLPKLVGNPLYAWSLMELSSVFCMDYEAQRPSSVEAYATLNAYLSAHEITARGLLSRFGVQGAHPCATITEDISAFAAIDAFAPSLRGDDIVHPTAALIERLARATDKKISSLADFLEAVRIRLSDFESAGCRFSDHALDNEFCYYENDGQNAARFDLLLQGALPSEEEERLSSYILTFLGGEYARRGIVMQLHIGAERKTSTRLRTLAGAQGGFAAIGNSTHIRSLTAFFDALERGAGIPKTVLFCLNPADNAMLSVLSGSYAKDGTAGLITEGPAWWWCDHSLGIRDVLESTAAFGLLYNFIGMTTDSRSLLSFVRHDYFRRILCSFFAEKISCGEYPMEESKEILRRICYKNANNCMQKHIEYPYFFSKEKRYAF